MDGGMGGGVCVCECWRHTATYLTYWLCVKSHPLDMAARCVALVIYSGASTLTLPCCCRECLINAVSTGSFFCQRSLPSAKSNTIQYCIGETRVDSVLQIYGENPEPNPDCFCFYRAWSRISWWLTGQDPYRVLKMSQVWIQLVTFVECHILGAFNLSSYSVVVIFN